MPQTNIALLLHTTKGKGAGIIASRYPGNPPSPTESFIVEGGSRVICTIRAVLNQIITGYGAEEAR